MKKILTYGETGTGAISMSLGGKGRGYHVREVLIHFSAAPTTSENITITLNSALGAAYDTVLLDYDPSADSATDIKWTGLGSDAHGQLVAEADSCDIAYTNTDGNTYGVTVYYVEGG